MAESASEHQALSVSGASRTGSFGHAGGSWATPSARTYMLNGASGHLDPDDAAAAVRLLRPAARHRSVGESGTVAVSGCVIHRCMESRSSVRVRRVATRVIQHAGAPPATVVRAQSEKRVLRFGAAERPASPTGPVSGFATGRQRAPLGEVLARGRTLEHRAWLALIRPAGPTRKWSRRAWQSVRSWRCGARLICNVRRRRGHTIHG